jgi:putative membrane protein insertion efficiency factor
MDASQALTLIPRLLIRLYQKVSMGMPRRCRFYPTCSDYALHALNAKGLWAGTSLSLVRILKCHPLHPGGYDPI